MSADNVELARRVYDAFNRGDLEALVALADDEVVVESRLAAVEGGYRGHEGVRRWWRDLFEALPDYRLEVLEVRDLGDATLAHLRAEGHGADSDAPLVELLWHAARWRDGKYVWWRNFQSQEEATAAARGPS